MPRLHPVHYTGLSEDLQMSEAIFHGDHRKVWSLLTEVKLRPTPEHLNELIHAHPGRNFVAVAPQAAIAEADLCSGETYITESRPGPAAFGRALVKVADMLFKAGLSASTPYTLAVPMAAGQQVRSTTAAQEAFAMRNLTGPANMPVLAHLVLQTLAEQPHWKPDIRNIFAHILDHSPRYEARARRASAEHISALGRMVGARLQNTTGHDRVAQAARAGLQPQQLAYWTRAENWQIDAKDQPSPHPLVREEFMRGLKSPRATASDRVEKNTAAPMLIMGRPTLLN